MSWIGPAIGAVAGAFGSRGGSKPVVTDTAPWKEQQPFLLDMFGRSQDLLESGGLAPVADFNPLERMGQGAQVGAASSFLPGVVNQASGIQSMLANAWDPSANPALAAYTRAAINPLQQQLMESILPSIRGTFQGAGLSGSIKQAAREGRAIGDFNRTAGDISANIMNNAYNTGLGAAGQAMQFSPTLMSMGLVPGEVLSQVGGQQRGMEQARMDAPFNELTRYQQLIGGDYGGTSSQQGPRQNPLLGAIGGGMAGAVVQDSLNRYRSQPYQPPGWGSAP